MPTGLYLYCLREPVGTPPETCPAPRVARGESRGTCHALSVINAPGVDGKGGVFIRAFEGVEAVVSAVSLDDFGEMQKKAHEDIHWIREKAVAHEMVVEEAMGKSREALDKSHSERDLSASSPIPVIPIKFGVIFNTERRLTEVISGQRAAIRATFDRIRGKQEWSVKLYLKVAQKFKDQVREQSEKLREKSKELAALPGGMAYFMEQELNEELERECSHTLREETMHALVEIRLFASEVTICKILDNKLTARSERMVLNVACLVESSHLPAFWDAVARLGGSLEQRSILLEQSGPWPAYNFTEFAHD